MPRKKRVSLQRDVKPDLKYKDKVVSRLVARVTRAGKKSVAERVVYKMLDIIGEKKQQNPMDVFKQAMENIKPALEVRSRRVGGATYQVPQEVRPERRLALGMRWLIQAAKNRKGQAMHERLAAEILEALEHRGNAVKKREDTHKMAEANRAFAHYRW